MIRIDSSDAAGAHEAAPVMPPVEAAASRRSPTERVPILTPVARTRPDSVQFDRLESESAHVDPEPRSVGPYRCGIEFHCTGWRSESGNFASMYLAISFMCAAIAASERSPSWASRA